MQILPNIEILDLALYLDSTLIMSDVHIGYEESLNKQGVLVPRLQFDEMARRLTAIFEKLHGGKIENIVINGDLKHEFGTISEQEWRNTLKFIDLCSKHCEKIVLLKGNHDTILGPIAKKRNVEILDYFALELKEPNKDRGNNSENPLDDLTNNSITKNPINHQKNLKNQNLIQKSLEKLKSITKKSKPSKVLIVHGDKIPKEEILKDIGCIIIGHEHPAITLRSGPRTETFKCFLKGKYGKRHLIVQPSFNNMIEGTNLLRGKILSPFLKQDLRNFEVFAVEDQVYNFGRLKSLIPNDRG